MGYQILAIAIYFVVLITIGFASYRGHKSATDFIIGGRSMNYWLTALAAHASDMSSWIFMGYPSVVFSGGMIQAWAAIGLITFMLLNWMIVAPKVRIATEQYNSLTFSSFFESRLADTTGRIRVFTALMSMFFYTIYISAALVGLGILLEMLFGVQYDIGIIIGIIIVIPYVFIGGYHTLAWIDLFQGIFLLLVIVFVPLYLLSSVGGFDGIHRALTMKDLSAKLIPDFSTHTFKEIFYMFAGWGVGYFGQPHIITKFMGIRKVSEIPKAKWIGMTWMVMSLSAATLVGLLGCAFFTEGLKQPELVFIEMVHDMFHPFIVGFILCAVLAATINAMSSQVLVLSSNLTEDFYKKLLRPKASSKELLIISRLGVILVTLIAYVIAFVKPISIYTLVLYAWSGLGSSFGPLLLLSLYSKKINKYGAWTGILLGGSSAAVWPYINDYLDQDIPSLLPGFILSFLAIIVVSYLTQSKSDPDISSI